MLVFWYTGKWLAPHDKPWGYRRKSVPPLFEVSMSIGRSIHSALKWLPHGEDARKIVAIYAGLASIARFGLASLTSVRSAAKTNIVPEWQYGIAYLVLFLLLIWTLNTRRLTRLGFWVSTCGSGVFLTQAVDIWPVYPSTIYYALMGVVLITESAVIWQSINANT